MANKLIKNSGTGRYFVTKPFVTTNYTAWTIQLKIITEATLNACTLVNTVANDQEVKCFRLDLNTNGSLNLKINTGVSGDDWTSDQTSSIYLETNTEYWLRIKYANTQDYTVEYSIDGTTYISTGILITSANPCYYTANQYVNFIPSIDGIYFNGTFDTSEVQIIYNSGGSDATLFDGAAASNAGIYNVGSTIIGNIATFIGVDTYIKCNGMMLGNDNVSLISKIKIVGLPSGNEKQPIFVNANGQGIYLILEDGYYKLSLKLSDTYSISLPAEGQIRLNDEYWIGYYFKNSYHKFGIIPYNEYSNFESLPAFDDTVEERCLQKWNMQSVAGETSWISDYLLIGADGNYYFKGEIDLSKTYLSNNIGAFRGYKQGYLPAVGTKLVDENIAIPELTLEQMYNVKVNFVDSNNDPVDVGDTNLGIKTVTNNKNNYYQPINYYECYVPSGSNVYDYNDTLFAENVSNNVTRTVKLYKVTFNVGYTTGTGTGIKSTYIINVTNTYNNYYKWINQNSLYIPNGSTLNYIVKSTDGNDTPIYQNLSDTITISQDTPLNLTAKVNYTYSDFNSVNTSYKDIISFIPAEDTNYNITVKGSAGQHSPTFSNNGGEIISRYTFNTNKKIKLRIINAGINSKGGQGACILYNDTPLLIAGGGGTFVETVGGMNYGGGGYIGGKAEGNRSGYSWDGSQGNSQTNPTQNANGGNFVGQSGITYDTSTAYGGTGNVFTVSGATAVITPTITANTNSGIGLITIEEL
jgi:hypothetical protein